MPGEGDRAIGPWTPWPVPPEQLDLLAEIDPDAGQPAPDPEED